MFIKDIQDGDAPFGGKAMILGGDFHQVLLVVQKGTKTQMISTCIVKSPIWAIIEVLHLWQNMWSLQDHNFAEYFMRVVNDIKTTKHDDIVKISHELAITCEGESSL